MDAYMQQPYYAACQLLFLRDMLSYPVCCTGVMESSRAMLGCLVGYMDVTEGSRAMLGYPMCYTGVMEES
jgi:hypothetical protein